jgi:K+-transporting ATPase c subunit
VDEREAAAVLRRAGESLITAAAVMETKSEDSPLVLARAAGITVPEVADQLGVTRQRVYQLIAESEGARARVRAAVDALVAAKQSPVASYVELLRHPASGER